MRYLDHAATAPVRPEVLEAMGPYLTGEFGNPSSVHQMGRRAADALAWSREAVASGFGATPDGVVFTSGGTEADNLAVQGMAIADPRGRVVVTTAIEHPAVGETCRFLERFFGFEVRVVGVDEEGTVRLDELADVLGPEVSVLSTLAANNEVGTVQPLEEIGRIVAATGVRWHVDAVQAAPSMRLSLRALGADALSISGHKLGAPKGTGALLLAPGAVVEPVIHGGGQQGGRRSGTEDVAGAVGLGVAVQLLGEEGHASAMRELMVATELFVDRVLADVPGARLTGSRTWRLPGHASFVVPGVSGESLLVEMDRRGIELSSGSACRAGSDEPSPVLLAMGVDSEEALSAVRFTFGPEDVPYLDEVAEAFATSIRSVRALR